MQSEDDVIRADTPELWKEIMMLMLTEGNDITEKEKQMITKGINMEFPIYWLTNKWYEVYPNTKTVVIQGIGRYELEKVLQEKEARETLMRKILIRQMDDKPTKPRVR